MRGDPAVTQRAPAVLLAAAGFTLVIAACGSAANPTAAGADTNHASFLHFSECMRADGVPNYPDPSAGGGIKITVGSGLNPQTPAFQRAQNLCRKDLPGGGPPRVVPESVKLQLISHAECMRAHGVSYPDPIFPSGGGIETFIPSTIGSSSPAFQQAAKKCGGP